MQKVVSWLFKGILHKFTKVPEISPSQQRKLTPQLHLCTKIASTDACGPDAHRIPPKSSNQTSKPHIPNCLTPPASFVKVLIHTCESPKLTGLSRKFTWNSHPFQLERVFKIIWKGLTAQQITSPPGCQAIWSYECCANEWGFQSDPWPVMTNNTSDPRPFHHGLRKLTPWNELLWICMMLNVDFLCFFRRTYFRHEKKKEKTVWSGANHKGSWSFIKLQPPTYVFFNSGAANQVDLKSKTLHRSKLLKKSTSTWILNFHPVAGLFK